MGACPFLRDYHVLAVTSRHPQWLTGQQVLKQDWVHPSFATHSREAALRLHPKSLSQSGRGTWNPAALLLFWE